METTSNKSETEKRTLMSAMDSLSSRCYEIEELKGMSDQIVGKLMRTEGQLKENEPQSKKEMKVTEPTLVELFYIQSDRLHYAMDDLHKNLVQIKEIIE